MILHESFQSRSQNKATASTNTKSEAIILQFPTRTTNKLDSCSHHITLIKRFGTLELQNRVTQNGITLRVTNSKMFIEIFLSSY